MKKTNFILSPILILAMLFSLSFTSCKKGWWGYEEGNGNGGNNGGGNGTIALKGTIISFSCGKSIYGNDYWIKLDNGKLIQPCEQSFMGECFFYLNEGDRVEVKYSKYTKNDPYYNLMCKIANLDYTKVTIDYIRKISENFNCKSIQLNPKYDDIKNNGINVLGARIEGSKLYLKTGYSGCNNETKRFSLYAKPLEGNGVITYEVKIADEEPQLCEAYFTNELCFDIALLKHNIDGFIKIKINGFDTILTY